MQGFKERFQPTDPGKAEADKSADEAKAEKKSAGSNETVEMDTKAEGH
jgi:hypothetical protein